MPHAVHAQAVSSARIAEVGHSLVNTTMPAQLVGIARSLGMGIHMTVQIMNGAPLEWQWNRHDEAQEGWEGPAANPLFTDVYDALPTASPRHDVLVVTERNDIDAVRQWHNADAVAKLWRDRAVAANPNSRLYVYSTWASCCTPYSPDVPTHAAWRTETERLGSVWEAYVDGANALIPSGPKFQIIPGHRAILALYDAVAAGEMPWAGNFTYFMTDGVHLSNAGNYYIALVHYATIYRQSPVGASAGSAAPSHGLSASQERQLQELAWRVVSSYPRSGVSGSETSPPPTAPAPASQLPDLLSSSADTTATVQTEAVAPVDQQPLLPVATVPSSIVGKRIVTTSNLNVRNTSCNTGSTVVKPLGSAGEVIAAETAGCGYQWVKIDFDAGTDGWVLREYVAFSDGTGGVSSSNASIESQIKALYVQLAALLAQLAALTNR